MRRGPYADDHKQAARRVSASLPGVQAVRRAMPLRCASRRHPQAFYIEPLRATGWLFPPTFDAEALLPSHESLGGFFSWPTQCPSIPLPMPSLTASRSRCCSTPSPVCWLRWACWATKARPLPPRTRRKSRRLSGLPSMKNSCCGPRASRARSTGCERSPPRNPNCVRC